MKKKFWHSGLKFECHQCGYCYTFPGGAIFASQEDFKKIAEFLNISFKDFLTHYTEDSDGFVSIRSLQNGPCIFYDHGCKIYSTRPTQCRTFPFWPVILKSESRWTDQSKTCQGINQGKTWSRQEITDNLKKNNQPLMKVSDIPK